MEELSSNYKLCEHHFEDKYYTAGVSRKRLLPNASPKLFPDALKRTYEEKELEEAPPKKVSKNIQILSGLYNIFSNNNYSDMLIVVPLTSYYIPVSFLLDVTIVRALTKQETFSEQTLITGNTEHPFLDIYGKNF